MSHLIVGNHEGVLKVVLRRLQTVWRFLNSFTYKRGELQLRRWSNNRFLSFVHVSLYFGFINPLEHLSGLRILMDLEMLFLEQYWCWSRVILWINNEVCVWISEIGHKRRDTERAILTPTQNELIILILSQQFHQHNNIIMMQKFALSERWVSI